MKNIFLVGGGGHCVSCIDVILAEGKYQIRGIFDLPDRRGTTVLGVPILGGDELIEEYLADENYFLVTVGQIRSPNTRMDIFENVKKKGGIFATVISPRAYVSPFATIKEGSIVMHDALVNANAFVGFNCIINTKALIEHDAEVQSHCHISTASVINGGCRIEEGAFVGSNSVLKEGLVVPKRAVLKAGEFHR